ncbi:hypothetical protein Dimus_028699 [Dionaea muscipula]
MGTWSYEVGAVLEPSGASKVRSSPPFFGIAVSATLSVRSGTIRRFHRHHHFHPKSWSVGSFIVTGQVQLNTGQTTSSPSIITELPISLTAGMVHRPEQPSSTTPVRCKSSTATRRADQEHAGLNRRARPPG